MALLLNREVIEKVLSMGDAITTVEAAFGELAGDVGPCHPYPITLVVA